MTEKKFKCKMRHIDKSRGHIDKSRGHIDKSGDIYAPYPEHFVYHLFHFQYLRRITLLSFF